jgi:NCS1 family nucleobase:cation symporter-1
VLARVSFGIRGAIIVAVLFRGLAGVCWFGFQALIGGRCLYLSIVSLLPARIVAYYIIPLQMGSFLNDMNLLQFLCFLLFIILNIAIVWGPRGISRVKNLETVAAPLLLLSSIALFIWALVLVPFPIILETSYEMPHTIKNGKSNILYIFAHLTAVIGGWSTMILNIVDFTRYALTQKDQVIGQAIGLPLVMTSFAFIGICVTSAAFKIYGQLIWNPVDLFSKFQTPIVACLSSLILALAITAGNLTANLVSAANDFCNLNPRLISFKIASLITAILSILILPWKLFATAEGFISIFLVGTSGILGSVAGIMISDYYLIHERRLSLTDLYSLNSDSSYYYTLGFSASAFFSFIISIIPIIPGFIYQLGVERTKRAFPNWILSIYDYAWFITFLLASVIHLLSKLVFLNLLDRFKKRFWFIRQHEEHQQCSDGSVRSKLNEPTCFHQINDHV